MHLKFSKYALLRVTQKVLTCQKKRSTNLQIKKLKIIKGGLPRKKIT